MMARPKALDLFCGAGGAAMGLYRAEVRNLRDVRWHSIEDNQPGKGTGRHIAAFILRGKPDA